MTALTEQQAAGIVAATEMAQRRFTFFLNYVMLRSDDPLNPVVAKWQPWPYLIEQAEQWVTGQSEIILKDRQLGYSWMAAAYAVWRARNGAAVCLISKGDREAKELLAKCAFVENHLPDWMQAGAKVQTETINYPSTGVIMAFPSTADAGVSFTFQVFIFDEAHFHAWAADNFAALLPTISAGGQAIVLSTADPSLGPNGWFPGYYWASKAGKTGFKSRFVPWHVRPGRDKAWLDAERNKFTELPEHFDAYYADTDAQAFVARSGLVYPMWNEAKHVKVARVPLAQCRRIVAGVDLGGGDPTAVVVLGLDANHHVHQYHEFYARGPIPVEDLGAFLHRYKPDAVECPPEQATVIATLVSQFQLPAHAANNSRKDGFNLTATLLENDLLTIDPSCVNSINEFPGYRWRDAVDPNDKTRYATKTPVDHHADAQDARRYAIMEIMAMLTTNTQLPRRSLGGRPLAKYAV